MDLKKEDQWFKKADTFRQGSDMEIAYLDSIIALNPNYDNAWWEKSTWFIKKGDYINYFKYMNKAVELNPKVHIGWRGVVRLYYLRDYRGAINDLNTLIDFYPDQKGIAARGEPVLFLLGKIYWQMKEYNTAIEYFDRYIKEETEASGKEWADINTFLYKGICLYQLGEYKNALESFENAIGFSKRFPEAYFHAGKTLLKLDKNIQACDYFLKAKQYANEGYIRMDEYREVFGQLHYDDIVLAIQENCQ
ncbi:tetratricopeptide repeat protein [Flavobacteriaceae bacterium]|nr:tetratricopeptide repeat protein [Flavobacteriaceae bacterium]